MADDPLSDFSIGSFTADGLTFPTYTKGDSGPWVVVIAEIPGITPLVADFARRVVDRGFQVVMPSMFGTPGRQPSNSYGLKSIGKGCVSKEFNAFFLRKTSPAAEWARALARDLHERGDGPGVGMVGMCFTGGFALAAMADEHVLAPVLSQPSLPFPLSKGHKSDLGIDEGTLVSIRERAADGACVLGLRFTADKLVPPERFDRLRKELGAGFLSVEIDSSKGNPHGIKATAHSVLTEDLVDEPGHPTQEALTKVFDFFDERLKTSA